MAKNGRLSLPLSELLEISRMAVAELIEVLGRTDRVSRRRDGKTARRRVAAAFPATEKKFRRLLGCRELWRLKPNWKMRLSLTPNRRQPNLEELSTAIHFQLNLGQAPPIA